jgi:hypothetical protein
MSVNILECCLSSWRNHGWKRVSPGTVLNLAGFFLTLSLLGPAPPAFADTTDRIFAATSYSGDVLPVYEITGGQVVPFAMLNAGGWIGPLVGRADGRLFAVTSANNGSLWDITDGGDLTQATPVAKNLFPMGVSYPEGMAFDADGNVYITNSENGKGPQNIAVVAPDGSVSYLPDELDNPTGLAVLNQVLYIAEGGAGRVLAHDLMTGATNEFATGFNGGESHVSAQLAVDGRGKLLVLWSTTMGTGLFDITNGGSFTGQVPLALAEFRIDVNEIAVDGANNVYAATDGDGEVFISMFDGSAFGPFQAFASQLGDCESVAVVSVPAKAETRRAKTIGGK